MNELEKQIIEEAQKMRKEGMSFKKIAEILNISLREAIHYCTDLKYKK